MSDYPATPQWLIDMRAEREQRLAEAKVRAMWARIHARQAAAK